MKTLKQLVDEELNCNSVEVNTLSEIHNDNYDCLGVARVATAIYVHVHKDYITNEVVFESNLKLN